MNASIDFNCLDLVISVESWVVLIDFFSASPTNSTFVPNDISKVNDDVLPGKFFYLRMK